MRILTAAYYEFLKNLRDIKMVALLVLMPIIIVYIVGTSLSSFLGKDIDKKITVGYINNDAGLVGKAFGQFLDVPEIKTRIDMKVFKTLDEGEKSLNENKVNVVIYLPEDLSREISGGKNGSIKIEGDATVPFVDSLVSSFVSNMNTAGAIIESGQKPVQVEVKNVLKRAEISGSTSMPDSLDYYGVLTMFQMLFFGAILGVFIMAKPYGSDMHIRLNSLPVGRWTILAGRVLGSTLFLFLSSVVTMLFTKYVYGCNWDGNLLIILGAMLLFCIITVMTGVLIGAFLRGTSTGIMLVFLLGIFFSAVAGSYSPTTAADSLNFISPNFHAKKLIFGAIYNYPKSTMVEALLWLLGILAVVVCISLLKLRRAGYDNI